MFLESIFIDNMLDIKRLINSFSYAVSGVWYALTNDQNVRILLVSTFVVLILGWYLGLDGLKIWILFVMALIVLFAEMVNTAIEHMVNLITREHNVDARIAKDVSAGMVLFTVLAAVIVGLFIFYPFSFCIDIF